MASSAEIRSDISYYEGQLVVKQQELEKAQKELDFLTKYLASRQSVMEQCETYYSHKAEVIVPRFEDVGSIANHAKRHLAKIQEEELAEYKTKLNSVQAALEEVQTTLQTVENERNTLQSDISSIETTLSSLHQQLASALAHEEAEAAAAAAAAAANGS